MWAFGVMLVTMNAGADALEVDRALLVRACRNVVPSGGSAKRPLYKLADLSNALAQHRVKPDQRRREFREQPSVELQAMFEEHLRLDTAGREAKTVSGARKRLPALLEYLVKLVAAMHRDSEAHHEPNGRHRVEQFRYTALVTLRPHVGMTFDDLSKEFNRLADERYDGDTA
jgi:hypothetical protein